MTFLTYLFITLALTIHCTKSSSISSFDDGLVTNKSIIKLSKHRSKRYSPDSQDRIIGGQYVMDISKYPFMVFVYRYSRHHSGMCGGTLISKTHVLTAAHCVRLCHCNDDPKDDDDCFNCTKYNTEDFTLYFGNIVAANSKVSRTLKNVHVHKEYKSIDLTHKCMNRFDIAVLELSTPVRYIGKIYRIKLPEPVTLYKDELNSTMTSSFFDTKKKCTILGWGNIAIGDTRGFKTRRLKVASVPLIGHGRCINYLFNLDNYGDHLEEVKKEFPTDLLCTDTSFCSKCPVNRNGGCDGDSGGPIICGGVQVGVVSWGTGDCVGPNTPNMYTRVDINVQWIKSIMSNKHDRMPHDY